MLSIAGPAVKSWRLRGRRNRRAPFGFLLFDLSGKMPPSAGKMPALPVVFSGTNRDP